MWFLFILMIYLDLTATQLPETPKSNGSTVIPLHRNTRVRLQQTTRVPYPRYQGPPSLFINEEVYDKQDVDTRDTMANIYQYIPGELIQVRCAHTAELRLKSLKYIEDSVGDGSGALPEGVSEITSSGDVMYIKLRGTEVKSLKCEFEAFHSEERIIRVLVVHVELHPYDLPYPSSFQVNGLVLHLNYIDTEHSFFGFYNYYDLEKLNIKLSNCKLNSFCRSIDSEFVLLPNSSYNVPGIKAPTSFHCRIPTGYYTYDYNTYDYTTNDYTMYDYNIVFLRGSTIFHPFIQGLSSSSILLKYKRNNTTVIRYEYSSEALDLTTSLRSPFSLQYDHSSIEINNDVNSDFDIYYKNFKLKLRPNVARASVLLTLTGDLEPLVELYFVNGPDFKNSIWTILGIVGLILVIALIIIIVLKARAKKNTKNSGLGNQASPSSDHTEHRADAEPAPAPDIRGSSASEHFYETIPEPIYEEPYASPTGLATQYEAIIPQRLPIPPPEEEDEDDKPYIHYDTPYEFRIFRLGFPVFRRWSRSPR